MLGVVMATLTLAAVLNGDALMRGAETKPYGDDRDFWIRVWTPFQRTADALLLDQPRASIDRALGREHGGGDPFDFPIPAPVAEASAPEPTRAVPTAAAPTATPVPALRTPTASEPLKLWVGGDSLAGIFGQSLVRMSGDTGLINGTLDYQISTGLSRPDYFNWPERLQETIASQDPDVMVLVFGSNDSQGLRTPSGEVHQPMTDGWRAEYRRRVGATMDLVSKPGRVIVWVGLPPMRDGAFSEKLADINVIFREEAARRDGVVYLDAWSALGDASGQYAAYLPDGGGHVELVREPDGVHLTRAGGDRLARLVLDEINRIVSLTPQTTVSYP